MDGEARIAIEATRPVAGKAHQAVVPVHQQRHPLYGEVNFTPEMIREYAANFKRGVKVRPNGGLPIVIEHKPWLGAVGWIKNVEAELDNELPATYADMEFNASGASAIDNAEHPHYSPRVLDVWEDPDTGIVHRNVLDHVALVVDPQLPLPPAMLERQFSADQAPRVWVFGTQEVPMSVTQGAAAEPEPQGTDTPAADPTPDSAREFAQADVVDAKEFGAVKERLRRSEAETSELKQQLLEERYAKQFSECEPLPGRRYAPVTRDALSAAMAKLHARDAALAKEFAEALLNPQTVDFKVRGVDDVEPTNAELTEPQRSVAAQLNLTDEEYLR